jgi:hypothetical protein
VLSLVCIDFLSDVSGSSDQSVSMLVLSWQLIVSEFRY